ncbi:hypothetical protein Lal_00048637 [Lupinus albus]|nr:hypothetical protein Lal_00048637 [Lupinus albus]
MGEGRGNSAMIVVMSEIADADTYTVGDEAGWTFGVASWPNGKQFEEGDKFVFKYDRNIHNVVKVNETGYNACDYTGDVAVLQSGNDTLRLTAGTHYFICHIADHCQQRGMKIALHLL